MSKWAVSTLWQKNLLDGQDDQYSAEITGQKPRAGSPVGDGAKEDGRPDLVRRLQHVVVAQPRADVVHPARLLARQQRLHLREHDARLTSQQAKCHKSCLC